MKKRLLTLAVLFSMLTYPATVFAEETTNVTESGEEENEIEEPDPDDVDVSADIDASDSDTENDDAAEDGVEEEDSIEDGDIDISVNTEELTDLLEDQFLEEEIEEIEYEDPENLEEEYEEEELLAAADLTNPKHRDLDYPEAFPMAYDEDWLSYMKDRYPATRNQGFFGTCWAHAAIGYAEFYAINHGWADKSIDLSEAHLVYWTKNTAPDTVIDNDDRSKGYSYYGGSDHQIYYAFGHGLGPAPEGVVPYSEMMGMQYNNNELSEDTAYHSEMQLTRGYEVTDISEIKELVMKNGAVCTGMYMDNWFDRDNGCYYNNRDNYTNHAVLIVGWDDNYPRENFEPRWNPFTEEYMGKLPEYNGAWLIRNSYTTNTENSVNSYFWMSYEDTSVSEMYAMDFEKEPGFNREYTYNGAKGAESGAIIENTWYPGKMYANVYMAKQSEFIKAVSFQTTGASGAESGKIYVYTGCEDNDPQSGKLAYSEGITLKENTTFQMVDVGQIDVNAGEKFSVIVDFRGTGGDICTDSYEMDREDQRFIPSANAGESFMYYNDTWMDFGEKTDKNFFINAFTISDDIGCMPQNTEDPEANANNPEKEDSIETPNNVEIPNDIPNNMEKTDSVNKSVENVEEKIEPAKNSDTSDTDKNGILKMENNMWKYFVEGKVDTSKYGFVNYDGGTFLIVNGLLATKANGLMQDPDRLSDWYFCSYGQAQTQYTGLALYNNEWFYIVNGKLDTTYNGLVEYNGAQFYVGAGRIMKEVNGLAMDPESLNWYYLISGQVCDYTGLVMYNGAWFYVIDGRLASQLPTA